MKDKLAHFFSSDKAFSKKIKLLTGAHPGNIALYKLAFKHKSVMNGKTETASGNNERLEYLGDAVLGAIVANHLYQLFPFKDEGFLTQLRSKIVSRGQLNALSKKIGLDELIEIDASVKTKLNSISGDALEALIGAIFIDKGFLFTSDFVINRVLKLHLDIDQLISTENDYKSRLIEWSQKEKKELEFKLKEEPRLENDMQYKVVVIVDGIEYSSFGSYSKKKAEQFAAEQTFKQLGL